MSQTLHPWAPSVDDPYLGSMNYLNQIAIAYPEAVSLAAGRPDDRFFDWSESRAMLDVFSDWYAQRHGLELARVHTVWGQYGKTKGVICENIAEMLEVDEGFRVDPDAILVTVGAQEGMALLVLGMCDPSSDVIITSDPSYVGMIGAAKLHGVEVVTIGRTETGPDLDELVAALSRVAAGGKRCRLVYEIPDFHNPTGAQMTRSERLELLALAERHNFLIVEDNPYGLFAYEAEVAPTIKSLDEHARVIYLGSFAKTLFPGLRMGYLIADQRVAGEPGFPLAEALSRVKSMITVNTSPLLQAMAGGLLVSSGHSLRRYVADRVDIYHAKRDALLGALEREIGAHPHLRERVSWTKPMGGFFLTVSTPFLFDDAAVQTAARDFGVIVCPMSMFRLDGKPEHRIRLSFSYADETALATGAQRLAAYLASAVS